jgi:hypothetical protein
LLMFYSYLRIYRQNHRGWFLLALSAVLLFNCHFIYTVTLFAAIALHAAIWHRDKLRIVLWAAFAAGVLCLPPILWVATLSHRNYAATLTAAVVEYQLAIYARDVFLYIIPYLILIVPLLLGVVSAVRRRGFFPRFAALDLYAIPVVFAAITILVAAPFTPFPSFRYLGPTIAPLIIVVARWVVQGFKINVIIGLGALALLAYWWPVPAYFYELSHPHVGPIEGLVEFLKTHGKPGDKVLISYEDLPLKFYTKYRVYGGLAGDDLSQARDARWVILRHHQISPHEAPARDLIQEMLQSDRNRHAYILSVPDTLFENREEPEQHYYATIQNMPPLVVYEFTPEKRD